MNPTANSGTRGNQSTLSASTRQQEEAWRFVGMLTRLVERQNLGALAALRRGLGRPPGTAPEMFPWVGSYLPTSGRQSDEDAYFLIAALFARHQVDWVAPPEKSDTNFGASCRRLMDSVSSDSIEHRFVALLNAHRDYLPVHLRHMVGLLKSKEIPIDWKKLLLDVLKWDHPDRPTQRQWARSFWRS